MASRSNALLQQFTIEGVELTNEELGRGAYARVIKVRYRGESCAAKEIHPILIGEGVAQEEKHKIINDFARECQHCSAAIHPNIVRFMGVFYVSRTSQLPIMVMELMDMNLSKFVENNQSNIWKIRKFSILHDVSLGLKYLHTRKPVLLHRDLSSNNVMLSKQLVAKIGDLGVAKEDGTGRFTTAPGTVDFMPPEALARNPAYGTAVDVFSFAGIALHLFAEEWPHPGPQRQRDPVTNKYVAAFSEVQRRQKFLDKIPGDATILKGFLERCLDDDVDERPSIEEVSEIIELLKTNMLAVQNLTDQVKGFSPTQKSISFTEAFQNDQYHVKWTSCRNLPRKLYNASVASSESGNTVYVVAGTAPDYNTLDNVYCYSTTTDRWKVLPPPGQRKGILHMVDNKLTIFGGEDSFTNELLSKVTTFNSDTNKWYSHYPDMLNTRHMPGVLTYNNYVIVMGGSHGPSYIHDTIEILDFHHDLQWKEVPTRLPAPMWNFKPTISSNNITIVGFSTIGGRDKRFFQIAVVEIIGNSQYHPFSHMTSFRRWRELPYPAHWETATIPCSNPPIIIGGRESRGAISDICLYNVSVNFWRKVGSLKSPRNSAAVALLSSDTIIVIGGCTDGSSIQTSKATSLATVQIGKIVPK